jgi:hypothetical protein
MASLGVPVTLDGLLVAVWVVYALAGALDGLAEARTLYRQARRAYVCRHLIDGYRVGPGIASTVDAARASNDNFPLPQETQRCTTARSTTTAIPASAPGSEALPLPAAGVVAEPSR